MTRTSRLEEDPRKPFLDLVRGNASVVRDVNSRDRVAGERDESKVVLDGRVPEVCENTMVT